MSRLCLPEFECPAIPDGWRLTMIEVTKAVGWGRYHRMFPDNYPDQAAMIDAAGLYVIRHVGWANAKIEFVLERIDDRDTEGRMVYDCDSGLWTMPDDPEAVPLGTMPEPDEDSTPTRAINVRMAEVVDDAEAMEVVR